MFPQHTGASPASLLGAHRCPTMPHGTSMKTQAATSTIQAPADGNFYKYGLKPVLGKGIMDATLKRLGTVELKAMESSNFVKPQSVMYELDGKQRRWDMISSHSSVAVIIYHTERDALLVVRQFRPPAYASAMKQHEAQGLPHPPLSVGFTYELCAGIIDKNKSLQQIAAEEVREECGYEVSPDKLLWVTQYVSAVGTSGSRSDMFYVEVDESMRVNQGGGLEDTGERIEVLALPLDESKGFTEDPTYPKSAGLLFGLMWLRARIGAQKALPASSIV
ncbi:hypothetical protein ABBQ38_014634 [Trebouxia sp. C0009 RCD-2024]